MILSQNLDMFYSVAKIYQTKKLKYNILITTLLYDRHFMILTKTLFVSGGGRFQKQANQKYKG